MIRTTPWELRGGVWVRETDSSAILTRQPPTSFICDFTYSLNPLAGCPFSCADCYVPALPAVKFRQETLPDGTRINTAAAWGRWVEVRVKAVEVLRAALAKGLLTGARIFMTPVSDVYWPGEKRYQLTRAILQFFAEHPVHDWLLLSTRSDLVCRDRDLLQQLGAKVEVGISIPTDRDDVAAVLGRQNPSIGRRFRAAETLMHAGISTRIHVAPLQPHTADFAARLADAAHWVWGDWHTHTAAGFLPVFAAHDWSISRPVDVQSFTEELRQRMGDGRVRAGQVHFSDRWDPAEGRLKSVQEMMGQ